MERRTLLATMGVGAVSLAGCISRLPGQTPSPDSFEQCETLTVRIEQLPEPAQNEVTATFDGGYYETDDELYLPHVIDIETTYLERSSDYFLKAGVESTDGTARLTLSRTTPSWGTYSLDFSNNTEDPHTVELRILRLPNWEDNGEVIAEETLEIEGDEVISIGEFDRKFGKYLAEATINGTTPRLTWREEAAKGPLGSMGISKSDSEVELLPDAQPHTHADGFDCEWDPD